MEKKKSRQLSKKEVDYVAKLANIDINQSEQEKYSNELTEVISYSMDRLEKVGTDSIVPTAHSTGEKSKLREDKTNPGLSTDSAMQNAKLKHNDFFKVKRVLGEE